VWEDDVLVVSETVAWVVGWWVVCVWGWVGGFGGFWGRLGWFGGSWWGGWVGGGCCFVSDVCQVVKELGKVKEG
jgi:hypothetical protein